MNYAEISSLMQAVLSQEQRLPVMLQGPPGAGKTALVAQAAAAAGKQLLTLALPTCEAVDLRGLPHIAADGRTTWASPLPRDGTGVLLLDEISSAAPDVQVAAHHLLWAESGSDMCLPSGWHICATGNRAQDHSHYRALAGPVRNRVTIVDLLPDPAQWAAWAMDHAISDTIVGFLRWRPELLCCSEVPASGAFASPRSWARASQLISLSGLTASCERDALAGTLGEGATSEFCAYLRLARELPSVQAIQAHPTTAPVPTSPSTLYALCTALSMHTRTTGQGAMRYISRLPAEFALLYLRDIRDHYNLRTDPHVRTWIAGHAGMFREDLA